jgi:octanoyl-[GcvH]:protein N-octanoyltransferase
MNVVHVYEASGPTVAFSSRDLRAPGVTDAVELARRAGFACAVRSPGGRMVAYDRGAVVVDHLVGIPSYGDARRDVFAQNASQHLKVLRGLCEADLRVGEVAEEYCPGEFSINVGGVVKVVGSAQRVTARAALFSTVIQVVVPDRVREVLLEVSAALGYPLRASSVGGLADFAPEITTASVAEALRADYRARLDLVDGPLPAALMAHVASSTEEEGPIRAVDDWARTHPFTVDDAQSLWR